MKRTPGGDLWGAVGGLAILFLGFGLSSWVTATMTGDPGSMDRGFGQFYGALFAIVSAGVLVWIIAQVRKTDRSTRRRSYAILGDVSIAAAAQFGTMGGRSVTQHRMEERASDATVHWRGDFENDLSDAYWAWHLARGGTESFYTGDRYEWWSLDPDRDGEVDSDAPITKTIEEGRWAERGLSIFDIDGDLLVDHIEWGPPSGESGAWCIPVQRHGQSGLVLAAWHEAEPTRCSES